MGRRSAQLRKERENQRALILASAPSQAELTTDYCKGKADRTRAQIELVDQMIEQADDADILDSLTRSKERLFRIWAHLAGIPGPGNLKPTSPKPTQRRTLEQPTVARPQAVEPPQTTPEPKPEGS